MSDKEDAIFTARARKARNLLESMENVLEEWRSAGTDDEQCREVIVLHCADLAVNVVHSYMKDQILSGVEQSEEGGAKKR